MSTSALEKMSARTIVADEAQLARIPKFLVSADSHVDEPFDLWDSLPKRITDQLPFRSPLKDRPKGGMDPKARIGDMDLDGVAAEVLYPTASLKHFELNQEVQEAVFPIYNDWVAEYCKTAPDRLYAIPCIPCYDIDFAVKELRRCNAMGMLGCLIWQVPDPDLPFTSDHYEPLWSVAEELDVVINLHILTGHNYRKLEQKGIEKVRGSVNMKTYDAITSLFDIIWIGVCERHPKIRFEIVEAEIGWIPFVLQQWDYYYNRFQRPGPSFTEFPISRLPSEIFNEHVYATFMDDYVGAQALGYWGEHNCMWSSDYPHPNMTWPQSRAFVARQTGNLPKDKQKLLLSQNVIDLYKLPIREQS
jgi:predicted TIM-barrel fold metal-dependent hydrolase